MPSHTYQVLISVHNLTHFANWVRALGQAWIDRDPEAASGLFPLTLDFHETPFGPHVRTREQIRELWKEVPSAHKNVEFNSEVIFYDEARRIGIAHWWAKFERVLSGATAELDGIYKVVFNSSGEVAEFRQWYNTRSSSA